MNRILRTLLTLALLIGVTSAASAQTLQTSTTLSAAMTKATNQLAFTSDTGVVSGSLLYVDGELMRAGSEIGTSAVWTVRRGMGDGMTPAVAHPSGTRVWVNTSSGAGDSFQYYDLAVGGTCTLADMPYVPVINTKLNHLFECDGGVWTLWSNDATNVKSFTIRENFSAGASVMQDDGTAKSLTDNETNIVSGSPIGAITYREEQTKTASSWITINGYLDISGDGTNDEGVEIVVGNFTDTTLSQFIEVGSEGACFAAAITLTDSSGTDQLMVGFRQNEAATDPTSFAGYTRWNTVGKAASTTAMVSQQEVNGGTLSDTAAQVWADGETRALKVCMSKAGTPTAYISDAFTASLGVIDRPKYNAVTMTNSGTLQTAGTGMVPFITFLHDTDVAESTRIQWMEVMRIP